MIIRRFFQITAAFTFLFGLVASSPAARIDADPSKSYELEKKRGPWMISVASFQTTGKSGLSKSGKTQEEAAHELILELRRSGMPAYMYVHDSGKNQVTVTDRIGREEVRKLRRVQTVLVLAGNYDNIDDKLAQDSLKWIKKLNPKCLQKGVSAVSKKGRPSALGGAFMTINPLLSAEEVSRKQRDPLLVKLNSGERNSLTENRGEYTLVIRHFRGKQVNMKPGKEGITLAKFLKNDNLDDAAHGARELSTALRGNYDKEGIFNNIDAYVWHDHYESLVTVGSFASPNDPSIARYKKMFGPRLETFPDGSTNYQPGYFAVKGFGKKRDKTRLWPFESDLQLMRVPQLR